MNTEPATSEARYGIIRDAMGAARDAYESALRYAWEREQFGTPVASFQLNQQKLIEMVLEIQNDPGRGSAAEVR